MLWADRLTLAAVRHVKPEDLTRNAGVSFGSALGTLSPHPGLAAALAVALPGKSADQPATDRRVPRTCRPGSPAGKSRLRRSRPSSPASPTTSSRRRSTWASLPDGAVHTLPLWQAALHLVNHSTFHRGQVISLLRQMGYPVPAHGPDRLLQRALGGVGGGGAKGAPARRPLITPALFSRPPRPPRREKRETRGDAPGVPLSRGGGMGRSGEGQG